MLTTIPNHPMIAGTGTASEVANGIEYASVPMEKKLASKNRANFFTP
jgi:hypothetical protein